MAVVDLQRWDRNKRKQLPTIPLLPDEDGNYEIIDPLSSVLVYADLIAKKLLDQSWAYRAGNQPTGRRGVHSNPLDNDMLLRYHKNGEIKNKKEKHISARIMCAGCMDRLTIRNGHAKNATCHFTALLDEEEN